MKIHYAKNAVAHTVGKYFVGNTVKYNFIMAIFEVFIFERIPQF